MGARPLQRMGFGDGTQPGGSHAPTPSYPRPQPRPSPRRRALATAPAVRGLQAEDLGPGPLVAAAGCCRPDHLAVRRLRAPRPGPLRRDRAEGALGYAARLRRAATSAQCRAGWAPPRGTAQAPPAAGHRPDVDPLPRQAPPRHPGDLPRPGQERHQPLPCLRHRLCRPPRPALHRRPERRPQGRAAQGGDPTPAEAGGAGRHPAPITPVGPRVLQRGGGPLPPAGAVPVPDAGGLPRPFAQAAGWPEWQLRLPDVEEERLVPVHTDRREEADGDGVDLREVPQLPGPVEAARPPGVDLCLLGVSAVVAGVGVRDIPAAVRDRVELPADARGADPNDDAESWPSAVVRGDRAGASEPLGVAALYDPRDAAARRPGDPAGAAAVGDAAAVAAPRGRGEVRSRRRHLYRKGCRI